MNSPLITRYLAIGYKGKPIVSGLNLSLPEKKVTALIGRNGAGKSTLIKTLTGFLPPVKGEILVEGKNILQYSRKELSKIISLVSTDPHSAGGLRLRELVSLGRIPYTGRMGILSREDKEKINRALETLRLDHKAESFVSDLSDGERQRGMIARGLVQETPIIILDEPFAFLDVAARLEITDMISCLAKDEDKAILFSTHEVGEALKNVENVWMFISGKEKGEEEVVEGTPEELIDQGSLDLLFPDSNVTFDKALKEFKIKK